MRTVALRVASLVASLLLASVVVFVVLRLLPGDSTGASLGVGATGEQLDQLRRELGTDRPVPAQYADWIGDLVRGDLGASLVSRRPVTELIAAKLPITAPLSLAAFVLAVAVAVPLGVAAATHRHGPLGVVLSATSQLGVAVPVFWVGVLLVLVFSLVLGWLPAGGFPRAGWTDPAAAVRSLTLPVVTVAIAMSAVTVRYVRSATLDVLDQEHLRTARSLGYGRWHALARHGLRGAAVPVVAILGVELATSFLGAVVVENVFALPGLGTLLLDSVRSRDLPVVQALVLGLTALVLVINLGVDLAQRAIDPRLRAGVVA